MKSRINQRLEEITAATLIVGIDIAKSVHYARFVDYRGREVSRVVSFTCDGKALRKLQQRYRK